MRGGGKGEKEKRGKGEEGKRRGGEWESGRIGDNYFFLLKLFINLRSVNFFR